MFDIGLQELIVVFIVALLVFGPKKLPELSRALGKGLAELRGTLQGAKEHIETEFKETLRTDDIQEAMKSKDELKKSLQDIKEKVETELKNTFETAEDREGRGKKETEKKDQGKGEG